jgi:D-alanyl-lipoteichoic acid acyltransferase DltB (MBOAT superfamily)
MNAREFLRTRAHDVRPPTPPMRELGWALLKLAAGLALSWWAARHALNAPPFVVGWTGMLGIILVLHFGLFHVLSWCWRAAGVAAPPIMRAPIAATSLAELWGARWNRAFADGARRFVLRPLAARWGVNAAGFAVFALSGLVHETVISLPARGGWGGPTLYFLLHGAGLGLEKSGIGRRLSLAHGFRGWVWTMLVAIVPLPLLFHAPFVGNVIVPFYRSVAALLP